MEGRPRPALHYAIDYALAGCSLWTIMAGVRWKNALLTYGSWAFGQPVQYVSLVGRRWYPCSIMMSGRSGSHSDIAWTQSSTIFCRSVGLVAYT